MDSSVSDDLDPAEQRTVVRPSGPGSGWTPGGDVRLPGDEDDLPATVAEHRGRSGGTGKPATTPGGQTDPIVRLGQFGKYRIFGKLGAGGFGQVYMGQDPVLGRDVAIKTCTSDDERLRRRFLHEAKIAAGLQHPNIVTVHDFGFEGDTPYMVQEYLSGEDLTQKIARRDLSLTQRVEYLSQVAEGLAHAHDHNVLHRDIKPANIRVLEDGQLRILDFGIARLQNQTSRFTTDGVTLGTVGYMAPELLNSDEVDWRCDIFSFGVLAYELLSYQLPFQGETFVRVSYVLLHEDPPPLAVVASDCPPALIDIVEKCLRKRREERFASFHEVMDALSRVEDDSTAGTALSGAASSATAAGAHSAAAGSAEPMSSPTPSHQSVAPPASAAAPSSSSPRPPARRLGAWLGGLLAAALIAALFFGLRSDTTSAPVASGPVPEPGVAATTETATPAVPADAVGPPADAQLPADAVSEVAEGAGDLSAQQVAEVPARQSSSSAEPEARTPPRQTIPSQATPPRTAPSQAPPPAVATVEPPSTTVPLPDATTGDDPAASQAGSEGSPTVALPSDRSKAPDVSTSEGAGQTRDRDPQADSQTSEDRTAALQDVSPQEEATPQEAAPRSEPQLIPPRLLEQVTPDYPTRARRRRLEATVTLGVLVGVDGRVERTLIKSSSVLGMGFEDAASKAAEDSRFEPGTQDGEPTAMWTEIVFDFRRSG